MIPISRAPGMRRASLRQPRHRRPFYGKTEKSFETYANRRSSFRGTGVDHGMDNFSYDPDHLKRYEMEPELAKMLSDELAAQARSWQCAAAALETSIDRTIKLYEEARTYAYPTHQSHPSRLRSASDLPPHIASSDTPPYVDSPSVAGDKMPVPIARVPFLQLTPHSRSTPAESPPTTPPFLSFSSASSVQEDNAFPLLEPSETNTSWIADTASDTAPASTFDPIAWETYTLKFEQQMNDVQEALKRMMGYGRKINTLCKEMARDNDETSKHALVEFIKWWAPMERVFVPELQTKIDQLETPDLAYLQIEHELTTLSLTQTAGSCRSGA